MDMTVHEQFADDLAMHALGALDGDARAALESHLASCAACSRELAALRGDTTLLALSVSGAHAPQRVKVRLMNAIALEPRLVQSRRAESKASRSAARFGWFGGLAWMAAAAMLLITISLWQQNSSLRHDLGNLQTSTAQQNAELQMIREQFAALTSPQAQHVTLAVAGKRQRDPQGKAIYVQSTGRLVFVANNMPALPAGKAYELWLLPKSGNPIAAGVFKTDARGSGVVVNPPLSAGLQASGFAITIEAEAGSATPHGKPMMVGLVG